MASTAGTPFPFETVEWLCGLEILTSASINIRWASDWAKNQNLSEISLYNGINASMKLQAGNLRYETNNNINALWQLKQVTL